VEALFPRNIYLKKKSRIASRLVIVASGITFIYSTWWSWFYTFFLQNVASVMVHGMLNPLIQYALIFLDRNGTAARKME